jgi:biotin transport system substrate-specific component
MEKRSVYLAHRDLRWIGMTILGGVLITAGSYLKIPLYPIPFTLQTLAIFILGLTQSPFQAFASAACYLLWASMGLPVLAGKADALWILCKSGGYILSFPLAAYLIARLRQKISPIVALLAGQAVIFLFGWFWLAGFFGPQIAWTDGVVVFLPAAGLKMMTALFLRTKMR